MIARLFHARLLWRTFRLGLLSSAVCGMVAIIFYIVPSVQLQFPSLGIELCIPFYSVGIGIPLGISLGIPTFLVTGAFLSAINSTHYFQAPLSTAKRWLVYFLSALCAGLSSGTFVFMLINLPQAVQQGETLGHAVINSVSYAAMLAPAGFWTARHVLLHPPKKKILTEQHALKNEASLSSPNDLEFVVDERSRQTQTTTYSS